jgi:hypothetical protein
MSIGQVDGHDGWPSETGPRCDALLDRGEYEALWF